MTSRYGLIGFPLGHSFSKAFFTEKFQRENIDAKYDLFPIPDLNGLIDLVKGLPGLKGLNVTIPYKQKIIALLNDVSPQASEIDAVNTIKISRKNDSLYLRGYNTDAPAFKSELTDFCKLKYGKALVLGSGGACSAVIHILNSLDWDYKVVSRNIVGTNNIRYQDIDEKIIQETNLIVNTTPLGMFPDIQAAPPLPYNYLNSKHYLFDLIYNPQITEFMKQGILKGSKVRNGMGMLFKQAELSWNIWQDIDLK